MTTEETRTAALLADLAARDGTASCACGAGVCPQTYVLDVAMGFRDAPLCLPCLAAAVDREPEEFLVHARNHVLRRDCFRAGWEWGRAHGGTLDG